MLKNFRNVILGGDSMHLAVGVVFGLILYNLFDSLLKEVLAPMFVAIVGKPDFSSVVFRLNGSPVYVGNFLNAVVSSCFVATMFYLFVKLPLDALVNRFHKSLPGTSDDIRSV